MSVLAVDIGNSATKIALAEGGGETLEILKRPASAGDGAFPEILRTFEATALVYASVVPEAREKLLAACRTESPDLPVYHMCWKVLKEMVPVGIDASEMVPGDDRCANVYGLFRLGFLPAVCVDVGTAVTTEILDDGGRFVGGTIAPGRDLQWRALKGGAAQLGKLERPQGEAALFGASSASSILSGIDRTLLYGTLDLLRHIREEGPGRNAAIMFTGGGGKAYFDEASKSMQKLFWDEAFTLKALAVSASDGNCVREYLKNSEL